MALRHEIYGTRHRTKPFQIDEELSHNKQKLQTEHAMAAAGNRTHTHCGSHGRQQRGRGRGRFQPSHRPSSAATAAAAQGTSQNVDSPAILHRAAHTQISPLLVVVPVLVTLITTPLVNHNTHVQLHLLLETMPLPKRGMPPIAAHIMHLYAWLVVYTWHQQ
jgi:hypothetical protein